MPLDLVIGDVLIPPLLAAAILGLIASSLTTRLMEARGYTVHFANMPLVFLSLVVIYTLIFTSTLFPA
jgi:hypothetical protein